MGALKIAKLRGVDVRILIPDKPDHLLVYMSAFAFVGEMIAAGIGIYRYQPGFMHQKVFLVDDTVAGIGTANLDNRSFRLNFEVTAIVADDAFARNEGADIDLERAIATLPTRARMVFVLHDVEGHKHREIAEMTGLAVGTCKAHLHRARSLLRAALGNEPKEGTA